jgi:hypothetical protein
LGGIAFAHTKSVFDPTGVIKRQGNDYNADFENANLGKAKLASCAGVALVDETEKGSMRQALTKL